MRTRFKILLAILILLLWLAAQAFVPGASLKASAARLGNMGKAVWFVFYNENQSRLSLGQPPVWPQQSDGDPTSTAFFARAIEQKVLENFMPSDLGGPGLPVSSSTNLSALTAANNAWCVTLNCTTSTPPETPFLFTRNFCQAPAPHRGDPPVYGDSLLDITCLCPRTKPFKNRVGVVVTWGGSTKIVSGKALAQPDGNRKYFNPTGADLPFLHP